MEKPTRAENKDDGSSSSLSEDEGVIEALVDFEIIDDVYYWLVQWEGYDSNGQRYEPTWVPEVGGVYECLCVSVCVCVCVQENLNPPPDSDTRGLKLDEMKQKGNIEARRRRQQRTQEQTTARNAALAAVVANVIADQDRLLREVERTVFVAVCLCVTVCVCVC
jgi:hypothetical protein